MLVSRRFLPGIILLLSAVVLALFVYRDYGVCWDEPIQREIAQVNYEYIFHGDTSLNHYYAKDHGVGFELPLDFMERSLRLEDTREIYLARHLATHLFFLFSVFCGYVLILRLFNSQWLAVLGFLLLAFHPRIYAHSFFNSKDVPFLGLFLISFLVAHIAFRRRHWGWFLLLGALTGYTTSIRIMGVLLTVCYSAFLLAEMIACRKNRQELKRLMYGLVLLGAGFCVSLYICWPSLWHDPLFEFVDSFRRLAHYQWAGSLIFNGVNYPGTDLPWYYIPEWFCITMPEIWLFTGLAGILTFFLSFMGRSGRDNRESNTGHFFVYLICFFVPVLMVIFLHSVVYDDWRHVYFIYPSFVLFILYFIHRMQWGKVKWFITVIAVCQLAVTGIFMVNAHPFQQVYFNNLVSHKPEYLRRHYDYEYWGCAYKDGLDYIMAHDTSAKVRILGSLHPVPNNIDFLPRMVRDRVQVVGERTDTPYYFLTNFRNHPEDYDYDSVFYDIKVQHSSILRVFKVDFKK